MNYAQGSRWVYSQNKKTGVGVEEEAAECKVTAKEKPWCLLWSFLVFACMQVITVDMLNCSGGL